MGILILLYDQFAGRLKNIIWKRAPEFANERDERMKTLINSWIWRVDKVGIRLSSKSSAVRPQEGVRYAVKKVKRAVTVKIAIEDNWRSNTATGFKMLKTVSRKMGTDGMKSF